MWMTSTDKRFAACLFGAGGVIFGLVVGVVPLEMGRQLIADDGAVQLATFATLVAAAILAITRALKDPDQRIAMSQISYLLLLYAAREADLHRSEWLPEHFSSTRFYLSADVGLGQKLVFGLFLISVAIVVVLVLRRVISQVGPAFRARQSWVLWSVLWAIVFVASQVSDQSAWNEIFAGQAFEEIAEFVAAGIVVWTVRLYPGPG